MKILARYRLIRCSSSSDRGLVLTGDLLEGNIKLGDFITFSTGNEVITLQVASVEMKAGEPGEQLLALSFAYPAARHRKKLERLQLPEQVVEVIGK